MRSNPLPPCRTDIFSQVVDEKSRTSLQPKLIKGVRVDTRIRLHQARLVREHPILELLEHRVLSQKILGVEIVGV
jgi:hypothetical protein